MSDLHSEHLQRFRTEVERTLGFHADDNRRTDVLRAFEQRLAQTGEEPDTYLDALPHDAEEWRIIASLLTVPETYFFRSVEDFSALFRDVLPERMAAHGNDRELRLMSFGCASGEEPYTMAIVAAEERMRLPGWKLSITGFDLNDVLLQKAHAGVYTEWALRATPDDIRRRYFRREGSKYRLIEDIRRAVKFEQMNLLTTDTTELRGTVDAIFFRNVLIYMTRDAARKLVSTAAEILAPGGYLFLGSAETLRGISNDFHLCHTAESFYYRRREPGEEAGTGQEASAGGEWHDTIRESTQRVQELADRTPLARAAEHHAPPAPASQSRPDDSGSAVDMFARERFAEALRLLDAQSTTDNDPDHMLFRAVLLVNSGEPEQAEQECQRLLARDELNAAAHYIIAVCREQQGDYTNAVRHDETAAYLDPSFSMPHVHRGTLARRSGHHDLACREFRQAIALLRLEDAARIVLLGGGFSREALVQMCTRELQECA